MTFTVSWKSQRGNVDEALLKCWKAAAIWFDKKMLSEGCGYVAVSRVKRFKNMTFLVKPESSHFRAVR